MPVCPSPFTTSQREATRHFNVQAEGLAGGKQLTFI